MTKWITLNQAAAKYETDVRNIQNWGKTVWSDNSCTYR